MVFSAHALLANSLCTLHPSGLKVSHLLIVNLIEHTNGKCHLFTFGIMQEEDILEHTNVKCHLSTTL
jgi:hypothetical protein